MARHLLCIGFFLFSLQAFSQEKCAQVPYQKHLAEIYGVSEKEPQFEDWLLKKKQAIRSMRSAGLDADAKRMAATAKWVIPVVVHVVHKDEALGSGSNIPKEQILSQLKTLNEDFRALNQTQINLLPPDFKALAADTEIEFVLAKQDPEGLPTDGIVRLANAEPSWDQFEDLSLKQLSHWPASKYLNIYVATLSSDVIGWAQFPSSDQLEGLDFNDVAEETDGVVVDYRYFGSGYNAISSSQGRTATHEIGHYFGLRHIWGDGDCSLDDFVEDTPNADKYHMGCPQTDTDKPKSCDGKDAMYQNYLDYSDDQCMALFTIGQKQRMEVVLQYSPRRKDLHYSEGKLDPVLVANDAGVRAIKLNPASLCDGGYKPSIEVRNYGNTQVTKLAVALSVDGIVLQNYTFSTDLDYLETQLFELDELLLNPGQRTVSASITLTNDTQDGKASNNSASATITAPLKTSLPVSHDFEGGLFPFTIVNPDLSYSWELADVVNGVTPNNTAAFINFYDYTTIGQHDILASPILDLSGETNIYLTLRVSHARYDRSSNDKLEIWVSSDCQASLQTAELVFSASADELATADPTIDRYEPQDASQWSNIALDLSAYAGRQNIQILLVSVNDYGNNLYLDDIQIINNLSMPLNVALSEILQPSPVIGSTSCPLNIKLTNLGTESINSLRVKVRLNGMEVKDVPVSGLDIQPLTEHLLNLGTLEELGKGAHILELKVYYPNGGFDGISADNTKSLQFVVNTTQREMPLRESYNVATFSDTIWTSTAPDFMDTGWITTNVVGHNNESAGTNFAALAQYEGNIRKKDKWLVSPLFDLSNIETAGMQFWYYAGGESPVNLRLLASADGGLSWPVVLWEKNNLELKEGNPSAALSPGTAGLWHKEFLSLSMLLQEGYSKENVRIALVATGEGSSSIYVDDIEFFLSDQPNQFPTPPQNGVTIFPNPAYQSVNLFFNMEDPNGETVVAELINSQGTFISKTSFPNTLNQIYTLDLPDIPAGIYYIRIRSASLNTTRKVVVVR